MVKLSKKDREALKRFNEEKKKRPFITYEKDGRVVRHKNLKLATLSAKKQLLLGRKRAFVDKDMGKFTKSIKILERKIKKRKR